MSVPAGKVGGGGGNGYESKSDDRDSDRDSPSTALSSWALIDFEDITVGKFIAGGGAGVIHEGTYKGERVALKALFDHRISEELKKEFMNELLVMSRLDHSNIVQFKGASVTPPNLCFVMEICDSSLDHMLHVEKAVISDYEKVQMAIDIAQAMEYLHSLKPAVIHRDLKALNVLRSSDGVLKLCDFGLVSNKISAAGTPGYMAPELFQNKPFNKSVDVYAFGVLFWEILSQERPWARANMTELKDKVLAGERPYIPAHTSMRRCFDLIQRCWDQNSDRRPSFPDIVDDLYEIANDLKVSSHSNIVESDMLDSLISSAKSKK